MFLIVSGSSGVGKNTVINELKKKSEKIRQFVTYTTRDKREGDVDGINYHFVSKDEFLKMLEQNMLCEYEQIHNNYYGSNINDVLDALKDDAVLIKDIGVEGAINLKEKLNSQDNIILIYLTASKEELRKRLTERGEKQIDLRLSRFDYEQSFVDRYDYVIDNVDLDATVNQILEIINSHKN